MKRIPGNASCSSACPQAGTESSIRLSLFVLFLLFLVGVANRSMERLGLLLEMHIVC